MKKIPSCLVLMATYNGSDWIQDQIKSIMQQKNIDVHLSIADDFSTDDTIKKIDEMKKIWPDKISYNINSERFGTAGKNFFSMINNTGTDNFDYICFSDQDDLWLEDKLEAGIVQIKKENSVAYSGSSISFSNKSKKILKLSNKITDFDFIFEGAGQGNTFILCIEFFNQVKNFIKNKKVSKSFHHHDWLVYILARSWNKKWSFGIKPYVMYRQHFHNETGSRTTLSGIKHRLSLIKNGWYKNQILLAFKIYKETNIKNRKVDEVKEIFLLESSLKRRLNLAWKLFFHGRRKLSDRIFLSICALIGFI